MSLKDEVEGMSRMEGDDFPYAMDAIMDEIMKKNIGRRTSRDVMIREMDKAYRGTWNKVMK